jgi:L-alanine-DL-glutamate epimerase-like enolase superfamily enzyme
VIAALTARLVTAALPRPWGEDVRENHLIEVRIRDEDGAVGVGVTWTPTIGAHAVLALLEHDIRAFAIGRPAAAEALWDPLWRHLHEAGSGGVTTIAMAGLDLALWDLAARRAGTSVPGLLGVLRREVPTYGSGVNRHLPLPELEAQVDRWLATGHTAVKVKVGGRPLAEDLTRVAAVRGRIGPDRGLMVDANQLWSLEEAIAAAAALEPFAPRWLEEPVRADDLPAYRALATATSIPIAAGENLHTRYRFREFMAAGALAVAQPNVVRVGGITPFLSIAGDAAAHGVPVLPHLLPELSGQLAMCLPSETLVEDVEDASFAALGVLAEPAPIRLEAHRAVLVDRPGLGIVLR